MPDRWDAVQGQILVRTPDKQRQQSSERPGTASLRFLQTHLCPQLPLPLSSGLGRLVLALVGRFAPRLAPGFFGFLAPLRFWSGWLVAPRFAPFFNFPILGMVIAQCARLDLKP